jgi:hypothetical protein
MSATEAPVDVEVLREEIRRTYTDVSTTPEQEFIFRTGRSWVDRHALHQLLLIAVPALACRRGEKSHARGGWGLTDPETTEPN